MLSRFLLAVMLAVGTTAFAQSENAKQKPSAITGSGIPAAAYQSVLTYVNPILPGDHPDPTLLKVGDDFYMCGSSFHFVPNLPVLHSRDLLHWETISRVVPAGWDQMKKETPGGGIWQGAITYFYGSYRIYFANSSSGGQYFSQAPTPAGPWTAPVKLKGNAETGSTGYDNSVFVDDDGTPYLLIKTGQMTNRMQQIGHDGDLAGKLINMDWVNTNKRYSWAEGPVMCKRNGWYYYFVAGDVTGGQYVLRAKELSGDSTKWEKLGSVVSFTGQARPFPGPNHISAPFQLADGTWWCIAQSYEKLNGDDWSGQGRQELLCQVNWDANGKPNILINANAPQLRPNLPTSGSSWKLPRSDEFTSPALKLQWHFLNRQSAERYSLMGKPGWLTIEPGGEKSHVLQKEAGHYYTMLTKVDNNPTAVGQEAGLYLTSGNDSVNIRLCSGFAGSKRKIIFSLGNQQAEANYEKTGPVWLKLNRRQHEFTAYYSADGILWARLGTVIDARELDKTQPDYNSWVGNSMGLYARGKVASFDFFYYKDAYTTLPLAGYNNYFGIQTGEIAGEQVVSNQPGQGGWLMLGGMDFGARKAPANKIMITAAASAKGALEMWTDDIGGKGRKIAVISLAGVKGSIPWQTATANVLNVSGQHDVYIKFVAGPGTIALKDIRFW